MNKTQTILLVDQDPTVAEAIALGLAQADFKFVFASDIGEAMQILAERGHELSLVVTDAEPRGHALALLTAIKAFREDLPTVVFGSVNNPEINAEALRRGAWRIVRKPVDFTELRTAVSSLYYQSSVAGTPISPAEHEKPAVSTPPPTMTQPTV